MVVGVCPPVTSEPLAALGHLRTTSHDHSYTFPFSGPREKNKIELLLMQIRFEFELALYLSVLMRHLFCSKCLVND